MIKKFISYYKPHMKLLILDLLASVIMSGVDLLFPLGTKYILNSENLATFKLEQNYHIVIQIALGLLILYIIRIFLEFFIAYWGHIMGQRIEMDMRYDLFKKLQTMDDKFFDDNKTGVLMSNLTNHLHDISEMSHHVPEDILVSVIMFIGSFIILLTISVKLTFILFGFILLVVLFSIWRRGKQTNAFRQVRTEHGELNAQIESSLTGIRLTKAFNNEEYELAKFQEINKDYSRSWREAHKQMAIFVSGNNFLLSILNLVVLCCGAIFVILDKDLDSVDLLTYFLYISFLTRPVSRIVSTIQTTQQGLSGFTKFYNIMLIKPTIFSKDNAIIMNNPKGDIDFNNVTFSYDVNYKTVLKNFSLHIASGKRVAIIGETGVGKTTISKLIPRFYDVNEGEILIDGINIKDYELNSLRDSIGHVQQDVHIFFGTIKENILFGKPDATMEEVIEASKLANIYDFIMSLEDGFETYVGERGVKLSGGQKQRVAIARLFLKQPKILILDEATSSLDNETERIVQSAFDKLAIDKTIIIIAHRLSTIRDCDEIIVVGKDGIIEKGSHDELLKLNGKYASLLQN